MESKVGRKRIEDKLQGAVVQDQTVQPDSSAKTIQRQFNSKEVRNGRDGSGLTRNEAGSDPRVSEKVVIRAGTTILKGYLDDPTWNAVEQLLRVAPDHPPSSFRIRELETDVVKDVPSEDVTALYYVKSFDGNPEHKDLNFHSHEPTVNGIWMRLEFGSGEVMEGLVHNSLRYLIDPGFFLLPTDPESNNKLVYVMKKSLVEHCVLGIRQL